MMEGYIHDVNEEKKKLRIHESDRIFKGTNVAMAIMVFET
jgi:hypothetical protein